MPQPLRVCDLMKGYLNLNGINRIFILGAGFSAPAQIPLTDNLLLEIHGVAAKQQFPDDLCEFGQAQWLLEKLQFYYPLAHFSHEMILNNELPDDFDLEKFVSYISVESACQLDTGEQFDEHGNRFLSYLKRWIAQAIHVHQEKAIKEIPDFYHKFVSLTEKSVVFTFNWDTLMETVLETNKIPYELDSRSCLQTGVLPLFKLHGSIDWFSYPDPSAVKRWMEFEKLGETFDGLYRAKANIIGLDAYYDALLTPWIIVPAFDKIDQIKELGKQWSLLYMFFQGELDVVIIGLSMREDDYHSRAIIYPQLVQGSQSGDLNVKVVTLAQSYDEKKSVISKFSGIKNCRFFFDGFSEKAIEFIAD